MKDNTFDAFGQLRSFWMFYRGMGLAATISLTLEAVLLWLLANLAKTEGARLRPIVLAFAVSFVVFAGVSWEYFFMAPVITELLIAACLVVAAVGLREGVSELVSHRVSG
jgi:hypothetical protein